jgi:hypothetical protein
LAAAAFLWTTGGALAQEPAPPALSAEQWQQDLDFMVAEMERRHANLYHSVDRARFQAEVQRLRERIPRLQRNEIVVGLMRIAALVGDGHTRVDPRKDARFGFSSLPLRLYLFEDGLYVRAAAPAYAALVGARVEAIGGVPIEQAIARVSELASRDNAMGSMLFVPIYLNMPDILQALGLSDSRSTAEFRLRRGDRVWTAKVEGVQPTPLWPPDTDASFMTPEGWTDANGGPPPLWLQAPLDYHRLVPLPDRKALYAQLNMVTDIPGQTLDQFGRRIRDQAAELNPQAIILDLRLNLGGNGSLRNGLVRELIRSEDDDTRLFVLTARGTFSASQFILDDLARLTGARLVGEPASSRPTSYGDSFRTPLPNSGISVRTSIAYWQEGQNRAPWTYVDIAAPLTFADYAAGRDPALEAALAYTPPLPLAERIAQALRSAGAGAVELLVTQYRLDPRNRYADVERHLIVAAFALARDQQAAALVVAELTTKAYTQSADAALVLGLIAEQAGRREAGLASGRRALTIDPNNRQARALVERLAATAG